MERVLTEYTIPAAGQTSVPAGVVTDKRITTPGAIALYLALSTLARGTGGYPLHCQATNQQLMTAAGFSTRRQLVRYRTELTTHDLLETTHTPSRPPAYRLPLNQAAQDQYLTVIGSSA